MDDLKALAEGEAPRVRVKQEEVKDLNKQLEEAQGSLKFIEEQISRLIDDTISTYVLHLEEARRHVSLLYPHMNLSHTYPLKVVLDGELLDEEYFSPPHFFPFVIFFSPLWAFVIM